MARIATRLILLTGLGWLTTACSWTDNSFGTPPGQLGKMSLSWHSSEFPDAGAQLSVTGVTSITGSSGDYVLTVARDAPQAPVSFALHAPGQSDLLALDGELLTMNVDCEFECWGGGLQDYFIVSLLDPSGPAYVAGRLSYPGSAYTEQHLANMSEYAVQGGLIAEVDKSEEVRTKYYSVAFVSDDGSVAINPGNVTNVVRGGGDWRAVAVAALVHENVSEGEGTDDVGCSYSDLELEMARVGAPATSETLPPPSLERDPPSGCNQP